MKVFKCAEHNLTIKAETEEELMEKVKEHMMKAHPDMKSMSEDEMMEMVKKGMTEE